MAEAANRDGVAILVAAPQRVARSVRVAITLPDDVLEAIDRYAESQGLTRSAFLAKAARMAIAA